MSAPIPEDLVEQILQAWGEMEGEDDLTEHAKVAVSLTTERIAALEADVNDKVRIAHIAIANFEAAEERITALQMQLSEYKDQGKRACELFDYLKMEQAKVAALEAQVQTLREAGEILLNDDTPLNVGFKAIRAALAATEEKKA